MPVDHTPSPELLKAVRVRLIMRGTSLHAWASANGYRHQNVRKALIGDWRGPKAHALIKAVIKDSGWGD